MGSEEQGSDDAPDWGGAVINALHDADDEEEDEEGINIVSQSGLVPGASDPGELPNVILIRQAVEAIKAGAITPEQFVEGVKKLDAVADNALKLYAIPAVKQDLPGKLTDHQNNLWSGLEAEIRKLKEGLGLMMAYATNNSIDDLDTGAEMAIKSLKDSVKVQKKAVAEYEAIVEREKAEKAQRAAKAAAANAEE